MSPFFKPKELTMNFVFQRDREIASVSGHVLGFKKGVATYVPPEARAEVLAAGGIPDEDFDPNPPKPADGKERPADPTAFRTAVFEAMEKVALANKRGDFTAAGLPHTKVLNGLLGWELEPKERDALWVEFQNKDKASK